MMIPDTLWASLQKLALDITSAEVGPSVVGPAYFKFTSESPFGAAPWALTLTPLDGSPAKTLHVLVQPKSMTDPTVPVTVSFTPGAPGQFDSIVNVTVDATQIVSARVLAIITSADGKVLEIDLYDPATRLLTSLHVAKVPSGMAADLKLYTFFYVPGVNGGLDSIIESTLQTS